MAESASILQTGSSWLRELTIDNMSNWSLISQLTTELILNTMAHREDDPTTFENYIHALCLLSSTEETGGKIRGLGGAGKIIKHRQFPEKRGEDISQSTCTLNNNLHFTLRTLRHLTEPDIDDSYYPRIGAGANLRMVLGTLQAWGGDETSNGLTLQVLENLMRESDRTLDTPQQNPLSHPDVDEDQDPHLNRTGEDPEGQRIITQAQGLLYRLETETHMIERATRTLQNHPSHHHITQGMGIRILQALHQEDSFLLEGHPGGTRSEVVPPRLGHKLRYTPRPGGGISKPNALALSQGYMAENGRNHLGTVIWKHHIIDPDAPMKSSLRSCELLPPRNDSLQQDRGLVENDSPEHHHTGPRIDSPETYITSSTSKLGDRSFRPDPAIQRTPPGSTDDLPRTHVSRGE